MVKRDSNQKEIVRALKEIGCSVTDLSMVGSGCPDLCVGRNRQTFLLEIKTATGKVKPNQVNFATEWKGHPVVVVRSVNEALKAVGVKT